MMARDGKIDRTGNRKFPCLTLSTWGAAGLVLVILSVGNTADVSARDGCVKHLALLSQTKTRDLKHGYAVYSESYEASPNDFEGRKFCDCLHYNQTPVAIVSHTSTSPTGSLLLFDDAVAGTWVLADAAGNRATLGVIAKSFQYFESIVWDEAADKVRVTYTDGSDASMFDLSAVPKGPIKRRVPEDGPG